MTLKDKILKLISELPDDDSIMEVINDMMYNGENSYLIESSDKEDIKEKERLYKTLGFDVKRLKSYEWDDDIYHGIKIYW